MQLASLIVLVLRLCLFGWGLEPNNCSDFVIVHIINYIYGARKSIVSQRPGIRITSRVDLAMSVYPSEWTLSWHEGSWASFAGKVCFNRVPRPLSRPQAAKICGDQRFDTRNKILTEMYCSYQYLSIDLKIFATPTLTPTNCPQTFKNRKYERRYLGNYQRKRIGTPD